MRVPTVGNSRPPRTGNYQQFSSIPLGLAAPPKQAPVAKPRTTNTPSSGSNRSSRGSSARTSYSNRSGGSSVSSSSPSVAVSAPVIPNVNQYLQGDTTYQDQIAQLRKAYTDYMASQNNDRVQYDNQYGLNTKNLGTDRTNAFDSLLNDYAGRGLLNSGVYGKAYSDLQTDYDTRQTQLDTQRNSFLQDLATNLTNFKGDQSTATTSAKQEAIARRAAKYGG